MTGFYLRVNGSWLPLDGVQSGVTVQKGRPESSWLSVGGYRHAQFAPNAPRTWELDFGEATPEAVTALAVAAQGAGGDVMLWDEQAARQNFLPETVHGRVGYPIVDCGGIPLSSFTAGFGGSSPTISEDYPITANLRVQNWAPPSSGPEILIMPNGSAFGERNALIKFAIPGTPVGLQLAGAELILTASSVTAAGQVVARRASDAWVESDTALSWDAIPGNEIVASAVFAGGVGDTLTLDLGDLSIYEGGDFSIRLSSGSPAYHGYFAKRSSATPPILRLYYAQRPGTLEAHFVTRDTPSYLSFWSDCQAADQIGEMSFDGGPFLPLTVPSGDGTMKRHQVDFAGGDHEVTVRLFDSATYVLAGMAMSTLQNTQYFPPAGGACRVRVKDPTLVLNALYAGLQGRGNRSVTIEEVH